MRKGERMNILLFACAGGALVSLISILLVSRRLHKLEDRADRNRGRMDNHTKWHALEAASRKKAERAIDETLASLEKMVPGEKKKPLKKGGGKK